MKRAAAGQLALGAFGIGNMVSLDDGKRLRLDDKVDFWPATGTWRAVDSDMSGVGMTGMLAFIKQSRSDSGQPIGAPEPRHSERQVDCQYCHHAAALHGGLDVYPDRQDLADRQFWVCWPCSAWVGCHSGTDQPFGALADEELRDARRAGHAAFDPIWQDKRMSRPAAYAWLAQTLDLPRDHCHIGTMELEDCRRVAAAVFEKFGMLRQNRAVKRKTADRRADSEPLKAPCGHHINSLDDDQNGQRSIRTMTGDASASSGLQ